MNRREFLQSLFALGALTAVNTDKAIEQYLIETQYMADHDFVAYVSYTMRLFVSNPSQCAVLTDIVDEQKKLSSITISIISRGNIRCR